MTDKTKEEKRRELAEIMQQVKRFTDWKWIGTYGEGEYKISTVALIEVFDKLADKDFHIKELETEIEDLKTENEILRKEIDLAVESKKRAGKK